MLVRRHRFSLQSADAQAAEKGGQQMDAIKADVGKKYLSPKGTTVTVVAHKDGKAVLKINSTGNEVTVPKRNQLSPYEASRVNKEDKALAKANGHAKDKSGNGKGNVTTLAGLIVCDDSQFLLFQKTCLFLLQVRPRSQN